MSLEEAAPGVVTQTPERGRAYVIETRPGRDEAALAGPYEAFCAALDTPGSGLRLHVAELCPADGPAPEDVFFLDLETTGLTSTPLFLIGTMGLEGGEFVVRQYLARDYSEEAAAIFLAAQRLAGKSLLVTFNGKSFDMPYMRMRAAATGVAVGTDPPHLDLLHVSRRIWRAVLPNCKLQTIESHICRRARHGDIPGAEIPDAYHAFVRTGDAALIVEILRHNMLDLVTMADIMAHLPEAGG